MKLQKLYILIPAVLLLTSCFKGKSDFLEQSRDTGISVIRYDRMQYEFVTFDSFTALQNMNTTYSRITQILVEDILNIGDVTEDGINLKMQKFFSDTTLVRLMGDVEKKYEDIGNLEEDLTEAFKKLQKEIPGTKVPRIYTQISALNESIVTGDSLIGISLDKYMGEDYPLYSRFYYRYQVRTMVPERIVPDCFIYYLLSEYPLPDSGIGNLRDVMLHEAKIYYVVQKILGTSAADVIGYTGDEKKWYKDYKKDAWKYMVDNYHLFATDPMIIRSYMRPLPYTPFWGEGSPAHVGLMLGVEIISSYMKNNKSVTLSDLLETTDFQFILDNSEFNSQ